MAARIRPPKSQYAPGEEISKPEWEALKTRAFLYGYDYTDKLWRALKVDTDGKVETTS